MAHTIELMSDCSERVPYNIPGHPVYASDGFMPGRRSMVVNHWHDDLEFGVLKAGEMAYTINGEPLEVSAGQGVFINARQLHGHATPDGCECAYTCILIHPSLLCPTPYLEETYVRPLITNSGFSYCLLAPGVPWQARIMAAVEEVQAASARQEPMLGLTAQRLAYEIAALLLAHAPEATPLARHVDRRIATLRNMVGFVQRHYARRVTLADIAEAGSVSVSTCCAIFRQRLGQSPMGYLSRYRLEKGVELLARPDMSVTDVALAVGFGSASYFAEVFHRHLGMTPSEYRRHRGEAPVA